MIKSSLLRKKKTELMTNSTFMFSTKSGKLASKNVKNNLVLGLLWACFKPVVDLAFHV